MLIYNYQKEFLGIDEKDLHTLGFNSFEELRSEVSDFADLFVKTPGYVHNFKHVHWIDFVNYADPTEELKVLINVNSKTFSAKLSISSLYLIDNPNAPAYMIHLGALHPLSKSENENLSSEVFERELPKVEPQQAKTFTAPKIETAKKDETPVTAPQQPVTQTAHTPHITPTPTPQTEPKVIHQEPLEEKDDLFLDVFEEELAEPQTSHEIETPSAPQIQKTREEKKEEAVQEEAWDNGYRYDPHVASKELGLPLDLIEEFIQDFIAQAKEFQPEIYNSIEDGDVDNVKILSHKLKGVAANLRIEDAHEVLSAVSATNDIDVIHENLNTFYKIITKLSGEPTKQEAPKQEAPKEETPKEEAPKEEITQELKEQETSLSFTDDDDDDLSLDFKDDDEAPISLDFKDIEDEDVPDKIEIPELADDDFLTFKEEEEVVAAPSEDLTQSNTTFSKAAAAKEIGIDEESFSELFDDYITESKSIIKNMQTALENDDLKIYHNEAIKLKGMSDNMRFTQVTNELEQIIHSQDKEQMEQILQNISKAINDISNSIGA